MPLKLGITGGVGSGKSLICRYLKKKGVPVVSADTLARNAVLPGMPAYHKIIDYFGSAVVSEDQTLDRAKLRVLITRNAKHKKMLEQFVHPAVISQIRAEFKQSEIRQDVLIGVEVPLLFEAGMAHLFDLVLTVFVLPEIRIARVMARDHITETDAKSLMNIQMPEAEKIKRSDFVIDNSGTYQETQVLVENFYQKILQKHETLKMS